MRTTLSFLLVMSCMGSVLDAVPEKGNVGSFAELAELFKSPPASFRSAPLWTWNDDVTEQQIDEQLADFKDKGIWGVFVHPRPGLITDYLSDRWNDLFRHTVERGKQLGMKVWIYDENSYPSGFAGGHVPAQMPESFNQGQGLRMKQARELPPELNQRICLVLKKAGDGFVDITEKLAQHQGSAGDYYLFERAQFGKSPWFGGYSYEDLLLEGLTEKFIEVTMRGYEKAFGSEFGKTVPGIFTDEPNISPPGEITWTPRLFARFEQRWGYDLKTQLPSLWLEVGDWRCVRHNYRALLLELFIERWSKPWFEYCEKNNLKWTGHYWEHGWPDPSHGPDNMAMYAWHHMPSIDILMNQYSRSVNAQFGSVRAVKEVRSAANQMGRMQTLSETYGAGGWDLRFVDMKRIADWQYVLGVNFLNQHLSYITIMGARKRDHPQSFSYHAPWWKHYRVMGDYCARLSLAMAAGQQRNGTLVLEPTSTAWMYFSRKKSHPSFKALGQSFQDFVYDLEARQIEYDLGSETILAHFGKIQDDRFIVGQRSYDLVVLPATTENLDQSSADLLETYVHQGGQVLALCEPPAYVDGRPTDQLRELARTHSKRWIAVQSLDDTRALSRLATDDLQIQPADPEKGILFHHRRQLEDGEILLLTNTSMDEWSTGTLRIRGKSVCELQAFTGETVPYPAESRGDQLEIAFELAPVGELLLFIGESKARALIAGKETGEAKALRAATPFKIRRTSPNVLTLDYCDLKLPDGSQEQGVYAFAAAHKIFQYHGLGRDPWRSAIQYKTTILDKDKFPEDSGFEASFSFHLDQRVDRRDLRAVVERPGLWQVSVNGHRVRPQPGAFWLDRAFGVFPIGRHVQAGANRITLRAKPMTIHSELEAIYILGEFGLESLDRGWKLVPAQATKLGPWNKQGLPMYAHDVAYTATFACSGGQQRCIVHLPEWNGTVAQVLVDGKPAGLIGWPPYELDITEHVSQGRHEISVKVTGSLKNLLGPHHARPRGAAWPNNFESAPREQPSGKDYDVFEYGLFAPFRVMETSGERRYYTR